LLHFDEIIFPHHFLEPIDMKFASYSKTLRTVSLTALMTAVVGASVQQTAQAGFGPSGEYYMACSATYFADPDYMYDDPQSNIVPSQRVEFDQAAQDTINAAVTTFAVELDAPIGYAVKKINGVAVEVPPEIKQAMEEGIADYPYSREKVRILNEKYGQYATFGQQMTLIYSAEQIRQLNEIGREYNARLKALLTLEEIQAEQELVSSLGACGVAGGFADMGIYATQVIEVGARPDLDARLREDTTGAIFFR
jgi:hypothetical protein